MHRCVLTAFNTNSSHRLVSHNFRNCFRSRNTDLYCIITASLICAVWNLGRFFSLEYLRSAYPQDCASWTRVVCVPYKGLAVDLSGTRSTCDLSGVPHCTHSAWNTCGKGFDQVNPASHLTSHFLLHTQSNDSPLRRGRAI